MEISKISSKRDLNRNNLNFKKIILTGFFMRSFLLRIQSALYYDGIEVEFRDFLKKCESVKKINFLILFFLSSFLFFIFFNFNYFKKVCNNR